MIVDHMQVVEHRRVVDHLVDIQAVDHLVDIQAVDHLVDIQAVDHLVDIQAVDHLVDTEAVDQMVEIMADHNKIVGQLVGKVEIVDWIHKGCPQIKKTVYLETCALKVGRGQSQTTISKQT